MHTITTVGLDIAKSVFQVHGVGAAGQVIKGISSCGCSVHVRERSAFSESCHYFATESLVPLTHVNAVHPRVLLFFKRG